ncbi:hypothetical protein ACXR2U_20735 [Jatrophihabitans sp. YIM 134969]
MSSEPDAATLLAQALGTVPPGPDRAEAPPAPLDPRDPTDSDAAPVPRATVP